MLYIIYICIQGRTIVTKDLYLNMAFTGKFGNIYIYRERDREVIT